jgi:hypothetical protein
MTTLGEAVEAALRAAERLLAESPEAPIASTPSSVRDLLAAGEDVVAYEVMCETLYAIDARLPTDLVTRLRQAATDAGADPSLAGLLG